MCGFLEAFKTGRLTLGLMLPAPASRPLSWLLARAFIWSSRETAALVRTTLALVRISAGVSDNVLPQLGSLTFNLRSHPGACKGRGGAQISAMMVVLRQYST